MLIFVQFVTRLLQENKLTSNIKKTKSVIIGSKWKLCNIGSITILVKERIVENVESFSYLGRVTLWSNMNWSEHVDNLCSQISKRLGLLKRIKHLLPHWARLLFYNSLVLPLFDYGAVRHLYFTCTCANACVHCICLARAPRANVNVS